MAGDELRAFLQGQLPDFMVPPVLMPLPSLPLTPNGKINRQALPDPDTTADAVGKVYLPPANPTEEQVAEIWRDVLQSGPVSVTDNFFELGGHSLLAAQVISRIRTNLLVDLPLRVLFEAPTVRGLSEAVAQHQASYCPVTTSIE